MEYPEDVEREGFDQYWEEMMCDEVERLPDGWEA